MVGVDAGRVVASVSDDEVFSNLSMKQDIRESVRPYLLFVVGKVSITEWTLLASVVPAYVLRPHFHSGEKPCYIIQINGPWSMCHGITNFC